MHLHDLLFVLVVLQSVCVYISVQDKPHQEDRKARLSRFSTTAAKDSEKISSKFGANFEKPSLKRDLSDKLKSAHDAPLNERLKSPFKQAVGQLEDFRKNYREKAADKIETFEKQALSLKPGQTGLAAEIDKIKKSLSPEIGGLKRPLGANMIDKFPKPDFGKFEQLRNTFSMPEIKKIGNRLNLEKPSALDFRKLGDVAKPQTKPEFVEIEELTIQKRGANVEPVKLRPLEKTKERLLKRGVEKPRKFSKITDTPKYEPLGTGKISDTEFAKNWMSKISEPPKSETRSARFPQGQKNPLADENDINTIFKTAPRRGPQEISKIPSEQKAFLKSSTDESEKSKFSKNEVEKFPKNFPDLKTPLFKPNNNKPDGLPKFADISKNGTLGVPKLPSNQKTTLFKPELNISLQTTKVAPRDRKIPSVNSVYSLDAENIAFPSERTRAKYLEHGQFVPKNIMINRIQFFGDKAYVTLPKLKRGVPFSLGKVGLGAGSKAELRIEPFPSWAIHRYANISGIVNAVDLFVDEQSTLWVLDSGVVWTLDNPERLAPPKVFAIDLIKEQVVKAIDLSNFVDKTSRLQHITVETGPYSCQFVYITDAATRGLIVWDVCNDFGSKITLPKSISPQPEVTQPDILYANLVTRAKTGLLTVTFLSSDHFFAIPTYALQNLKYGTETGDVTYLGRKPEKLVVLGTDRKWVYFRFASSGDIYAWDVGTDFREENFRKLRTGNGAEFATQVTVGYKKFVWALESNFQEYGKLGEQGKGGESGLVFSIRAVCRSSDL